jgi:hypothetical protein
VLWFVAVLLGAFKVDTALVGVEERQQVIDLVSSFLPEPHQDGSGVTTFEGVIGRRWVADHEGLAANGGRQGCGGRCEVLAAAMA